MGRGSRSRRRLTRLCGVLYTVGMFRGPFWKSAAPMLQYKRPLVIATIAVVVNGVCFGGGLSMMLPIFHLFLREGQTLDDLIEQYLVADRPDAVADFGRWLMDLVPDDRFQAFLVVMAACLVITVVGNMARYVHELMVMTVSQRVAMLWRARLFRRLMHAPITALAERGGADGMSRLTHDTQVMSGGYRVIMGKSVIAIGEGVFALAAALFIDAWLTSLALVGAPVIAVVLRKFGKRIRKATKKALGQRGQMLRSLKETLGGVAVVKVHDAEGQERRRFNRINHELFNQEMTMRQVKALSSPLVEIMAIFGVILVAIVAASHILGGGAKPEEFGVILILLGAAMARLRPVTNLHNLLHEYNAAAERVFEMLDMPAEPVGADAPKGLPSLGRHSRSVEFDAVTYQYPSQQEPAVRDLSLHVEHGRTIAVVGTNGAGKSTLLSLLPRLLEPSSGQVRIDGTDVSTVSLRSLRRQIGMVTQRTVLFAGSIADNIAYGRRHVSRARIVTAAKAAHADAFIRALPKGYDTLLGEDGVGLSGGQMQRISIARAILRDPAILILDEATSQIDAESESEIARALREISVGRTTFIIAHRLSTVVDADQIVVMDAGTIVDKGRHDELLRRCRIYQMLTQTQLRPAESVA